MTDDTALSPTPRSGLPGHPLTYCDGSELEPYCRQVRALVSRARLEHIERVTETAVAIAQANGLDEAQLHQVRLAAALHDAARDLPAADLLRLGGPAGPMEREHPLTLHGRAARTLAASWGVTDEVVLDAIEGHVFGVAPSNAVGMCVYVADVCEPGRGVNQDLRELAMHDLFAAYRLAVASKVHYLEANGKPVHPQTRAVYRSLVGEDGE